MELKGRLIDITRDILQNEFQIRLSVLTLPSGVASLREEGDLAITLKRWREKRSLSANAYYWVLVGKIADYLHESSSFVHNVLLREYGTLEIIDGETMTIMAPDTDEAENKILHSDFYHLKPTSHTKVGKTGTVFRAYRVIKGSSEYDTKEFSRLIDGAVSEAKNMGIETLPDEELERMKEAYEKHHSN